MALALRLLGAVGLALGGLHYWRRARKGESRPSAEAEPLLGEDATAFDAAAESQQVTAGREAAGSGEAPQLGKSKGVADAAAPASVLSSPSKPPAAAPAAPSPAAPAAQEQQQHQPPDSGKQLSFEAREQQVEEELQQARGAGAGPDGPAAEEQPPPPGAEAGHAPLAPAGSGDEQPILVPAAAVPVSAGHVLAAGEPEEVEEAPASPARGPPGEAGAKHAPAAKAAGAQGQPQVGPAGSCALGGSFVEGAGARQPEEAGSSELGPRSVEEPFWEGLGSLPEVKGGPELAGSPQQSSSAAGEPGNTPPGEVVPPHSTAPAPAAAGAATSVAAAAVVVAAWEAATEPAPHLVVGSPQHSPLGVEISQDSDVSLADGLGEGQYSPLQLAPGPQQGQQEGPGLAGGGGGGGGGAAESEGEAPFPPRLLEASGSTGSLGGPTGAGVLEAPAPLAGAPSGSSSARSSSEGAAPAPPGSRYAVPGGLLGSEGFPSARSGAPAPAPPYPAPGSSSPASASAPGELPSPSDSEGLGLPELSLAAPAGRQSPDAGGGWALLGAQEPSLALPGHPVLQAPPAPTDDWAERPVPANPARLSLSDWVPPAGEQQAQQGAGPPQGLGSPFPAPGLRSPPRNPALPAWVPGPAPALGPGGPQLSAAAALEGAVGGGGEEEEEEEEAAGGVSLVPTAPLGGLQGAEGASLRLRPPTGTRKSLLPPGGGSLTFPPSPQRPPGAPAPWGAGGGAFHPLHMRAASPQQQQWQHHQQQAYPPWPVSPTGSSSSTASGGNEPLRPPASISFLPFQQSVELQMGQPSPRSPFSSPRDARRGGQGGGGGAGPYRQLPFGQHQHQQQPIGGQPQFGTHPAERPISPSAPTAAEAAGAGAFGLGGGSMHNPFAWSRAQQQQSLSQPASPLSQQRPGESAWSAAEDLVASARAGGASEKRLRVNEFGAQWSTQTHPHHKQQQQQQQHHHHHHVLQLQQQHQLLQRQESEDDVPRLALQLVCVAGPCAEAGSAYVTKDDTTEVVLGRSPGCTMQLNDAEVSGRHLLIHWNSADKCWEVADLGSLNGTLLNSEPISQARKRGRDYRLSSDDILQLGTFTKVKVSTFPREMLDPSDRHGSLPVGSLPKSLSVPKHRIPSFTSLLSPKINTTPSKKATVAAASDELRLECCIISRAGRDHMRKGQVCEDVASAVCPLPTAPDCPAADAFPSLFCVFDGHCGRAAAEEANTLLPDEVAARLAGHAQELGAAKGVAAMLREAFLATDDRIKAEEGCTATVVLVWRDEDGAVCLQAANVGDSAALFLRPQAGTCATVTEDHRLSNPRERERLQRMGIQVTNDTRRLYGLNLARGLGDKFLKDEDLGLSAEPFVSHVLRVPAGEGGMLLIASDGLWDFAEQDTVANVALGTDRESDGSVLEVAEAVIGYAVKQRTRDDVTVLVARIWPESEWDLRSPLRNLDDGAAVSFVSG